MSSETVKVSRDGPTAVSTKVNGNREKLKDTEYSIMLMAISTKAIGKMIKPMAQVLTLTQMEPSTSASGKTISSMVRDWSRGLTTLSMMVNTRKARNTAKVN